MELCSLSKKRQVSCFTIIPKTDVHLSEAIVEKNFENKLSKSLVWKEFAEWFLSPEVLPWCYLYVCFIFPQELL